MPGRPYPSTAMRVPAHSIITPVSRSALADRKSPDPSARPNVRLGLSPDRTIKALPLAFMAPKEHALDEGSFTRLLTYRAAFCSLRRRFTSSQM